jgi:hypothetical protein
MALYTYWTNNCETPRFDHYTSCATCGDENLEPSRSQRKCSTF